MARPAKSNDERRSVFLRVRVTVAEKSRLEEKAADAGMNISDWMRSRSIDATPLMRKPHPNKEVLLRLLAEYGKAASNCNQIARQLNRRQENLEYEIPIKAIYYVLQEMKQITAQLRETLTNVGNKRQDSG